MIIVSKDDMKQEMKKLRPIIRNWFDQLIKQNVMRKKPKIITDKLKDKLINDIWKLFDKKDGRKKKQNEKIIKDKVIADIRTLFEQEKGEDYYEPKRVSNFWNNNYIKYESNSDKNKNLLLDEYLYKIESYLRNIIIYLKYSDTWKIQLTIEIISYFLTLFLTLFITLFLQKIVKKSV